ncbi:MAG: hypothetical protein SF053_10790 [Bacteroidia bacterium]|nr:hypothetical protein [Bacteroidia bacterium]
MKTYILYFFLLIGMLHPLQGQKTRTAEGSYQLNLSRSTYTEAEACEYCRSMAMIDAIEQAFGRVIVQGNTTVIQNVTTGETVSTGEVFNLLAETYVNGEWIETLDESCDRFTEGGEFWVRCTARGKVREWTQPVLDLRTQALNCEAVHCGTDRFVDGDPLYLYVKSPKSGYLTVYLADGDTAQRLLPYRQMPGRMQEAIPIEADRAYVLFSMRTDPFKLGPYVDEYEMVAHPDQPLHRMYVVFSEKPLTKPLLYRSDAGGALPLSLSLADFQQWLARQRQYQSDLYVKRLDLLVTPR